MKRKSRLVAVLLLAGLVVWVASGHLLRAPSATVATAEETSPEKSGVGHQMTVRVEDMAASPITRTLRNQGQTEANRIVVVRAETTGTVEAVLVPKGQPVKAGEPLVRLRMDDRDIKLSEARAAITLMEAEFNAARDMAADGFQSGNAVRQAAAALEKARAELRAIELDRERTVIRAPFDGVLNNRMVETGDYVAANTAIAQVVDNDPLVVAVNVSQQDVMSITPGQPAHVRLMTGEQREGTVRYLASASDTGTRTFRVEVELANSERALLAGLSAEVSMPVGQVQAHRISPALLALDEDNRLVVKTVGEAGVVEFHPVEVIRNEPGGVWVTGLPELARVITAGQGFVIRGQSVQLADQTTLSSRAPH
ncbi:MAG: efflux RND transporter periplasmic adaptor subunit [Aquisalimonadaceae bacterium]